MQLTPTHRVCRRLCRRWPLLFVTALGVLSSLPLRAAADESSGTWTGSAETRFNYFLERSTRVMMPAARVDVAAPNGIRARATYMLDVISSASIAQTGGSSDGVFHEVRHGIGAMSVGKKIDTGSAELDLSVSGTYSTEDDYKSLLYGIAGSAALNDKNTTLSLGLTRVDDTIESNIDPTFRGKLTGLTLGVGAEQLLSPVLKLNVGYQLSSLDGFLGNPYRRALVGARAQPGSSKLMGGLPESESPPDTRLRHNLEAQLSWYLPRSWTTFQFYFRTYLDSWSLQAQTPELRVYQQLGQDLVLRARYRYYTQTRAEFAPEDGQTAYPVGYMGPLTNDPKMTGFDSHQIGLRLAYRLSFLSRSFLRFMQNTMIDLSVDRQFCTSSFGDYWIATAGGRVPF